MIEEGEKPAGYGDDDGGDDGEREHPLTVPEPDESRSPDPPAKTPDERRWNDDIDAIIYMSK